MANEKTFDHQMQPDESLLPENRDQKQSEQKEEVDNNSNNNRMNMSGPSMRPTPRPSAKALTPEQKKALEQASQRSRKLTQQMAATQNARQNWINKPRLMRRIQRTLAKDPMIRNAVFRIVKGGPIAFTSLDAKTQLRIVKKADKILRRMARNTVNTMQGYDPNDVTHPLNQANPTNLANQQQAIQQAIIIEQDNQVMQNILAMDNQASNQEQLEEEMAENAEAAIVLTAAEEKEINDHNASEFNPSPKPNTQSNDDEKNKESNKTSTEDHIAKSVLEHKGEEKALHCFMENDKHGFIKGAKGASMEVGKEVLEKTVMTAAKGLLMGA